MNQTTQSGESKDSLYDRSILTSLDLSTIERDVNLPPGCTALSPGPGLLIRPLCITDHSAGFAEILGQLTEIGEVSEEMFRESFLKMKSCGDTYYVTVIEDTQSGQIVGSGTLLVEQKFIHGCALRGRLEDIVVSDRYRGKQLGKVIVLLLTRLSSELNCYKVSLDCKDHNRPFYESLGYTKDAQGSNFMVIRYRT